MSGLVKKLLARAASGPEWTEFTNWSLKEVAGFHEPQGFSRREFFGKIPFKIRQDPMARLGRLALSQFTLRKWIPRGRFSSNRAQDT
jgi:hypothetical protein